MNELEFPRFPKVIIPVEGDYEIVISCDGEFFQLELHDLVPLDGTGEKSIKVGLNEAEVDSFRYALNLISNHLDEIKRSNKPVVLPT